VTTREEAVRIPTSVLWQGRNQQQCDEMVDALQDAGISFLTESETEPAEVGREVFIGLLKVLFLEVGGIWEAQVGTLRLANQGFAIRLPASERHHPSGFL